MEKDEEARWLPVIGKALAAMAMHKANLGDGDTIEKAEFLEGLGIPRADVARMIGSTSESLRVMFATRKKKKSGGKGRGKKD